MSKASILIPSRRPLAECVEPIWSAIEFARNADMNVLISDNSGSEEKARYFEGAPSHVRHLRSPSERGLENLHHGLCSVDSEFVLVLGDDDFIKSSSEGENYRFPPVTDDVVAVKPRIELYDAARVLREINAFTVDADGVPERLVEYAQKMNGGNSSYYSFFRTKPFSDIVTLLVQSHPGPVGNMDFAIVFAMIAEGRMIHDGGVVVEYDNSRWSETAAALLSMEQLFADAGLPAEALRYMLVLHFLDAFVLLLRHNSRLPPLDRLRGAYTMAVLFLNRFIERTRSNPAAYAASAEPIDALARAMENEDPDPNEIFLAATMTVDAVKPGLRDAYGAFLNAAMRGAEQQLI